MISCLHYPIWIHGFPYKALLDTGAGVNVIHPRVVSSLNLPPQPHVGSLNVVTAGGSTFSLRAFYLVPIAIAGITLQVPCYSLDIPADVILGMPFVKEHHPLVDWNTGRLSTSTFVVDPIDALSLTPVLACTPRSAFTPLTATPPKPSYPPAIQHVLDKAAPVFAEPQGLPPPRPVEHTINLIPDARIPTSRCRRFAPPEKREIRAELDKLLRMGHIRPSTSPFGANILFVKKKDGGKRMCVDYRALNRITVPDRYPLPHVTDILLHLQRASVFSKMDLHQGFHQIRIRESDCHKTAFVTPFGAFEWTVLPFGLCNAPASFQRMVDIVFRDMIGQHVVVYVDDILVYSEDVHAHAGHLRAVLDRLHANELSCKLSKCVFATSTLEFCGHRLQPGRVCTTHDKVQRISEWPVPTNIKQLRSFLGFAGFYRRFIPHFADLSSAFGPLLKKGAPWSWAPNQHAAFLDLKQAFAEVTTLSQPDYGKPFFLHVDASDLCTGGTLSQFDPDGTLRLIECRSKRSSPAETRYPTHERELLALVEALGQWRHHLLDADVVVLSDSICLTYFATQPNLTSRQARWAQKLADYHLTVRHIPGTQNAAADALSRLHDIAQVDVPTCPLPHQLHVTPVAPEPNPPVASSWLPAYQQDATIRERYLDGDGQPKPTAFFRSGRLWRDSRVLVPTSKVLDVIRCCHEPDHWGIAKTIELVQRRHDFPNIAAQVRAFVRSCDTCQRIKSMPNRVPVKHMPFPCQRWHSICLDWIEGMPAHGPEQHDSILVVVDHATRYTHLVPTKKASSGKDLAHQLLNTIFRLHGFPRVIRTDRDTRVTSAFWRDLCELLDVKPTPTVAYHPRANGAVERTNALVSQLLKVHAAHDPDWVNNLPMVEMALNNRCLGNSSYTPYYLNYGFHPTMVSDLKLDHDTDQTIDETAKDFVTHATFV